jgi:hypothetical protein
MVTGRVRCYVTTYIPSLQGDDRRSPHAKRQKKYLMSVAEVGEIGQLAYYLTDLFDHLSPTIYALHSEILHSQIMKRITG